MENKDKSIIKTDVHELNKISFKDRYDHLCSIQDSSLANEACIWIGRYGARMRLTQEQVSDLLPFLQHFVKTGTINMEPVIEWEQGDLMENLCVHDSVYDLSGVDQFGQKYQAMGVYTDGELVSINDIEKI